MKTRKIGVVGAGTMGHGIAQVAAQGGFDVVMCDVTEELVEAGRTRIRANLDKGVELGKLDSSAAGAAFARIATVAEPSGLADADLLIEAVPEELALKRATFAELAAVCSPQASFATNTSSLSLAAIAAELEDPGRLVGMHFFNPVHLMPLLEVVRHERLRDEVLEEALEVGGALGKTPIVVRDTPGFATSRLGVVIGLEAMRMLEQGVASAEDIDKAMELGYRHPMGPLRLTDLVGLDVRLAIARYLHEELGSEAFRPPEILERMVAEGKLGKKSGRGFYEW